MNLAITLLANLVFQSCLVAKSCLTLCNPMDSSLSDSSVHGIFQARILGWVAISFSRGSSWPRDWTHVLCVSRRFFPTEPSGKPLDNTYSMRTHFRVSVLQFALLCPSDIPEMWSLTTLWDRWENDAQRGELTCPRLYVPGEPELWLQPRVLKQP